MLTQLVTQLNQPMISKLQARLFATCKPELLVASQAATGNFYQGKWFKPHQKHVEFPVEFPGWLSSFGHRSQVSATFVGGDCSRNLGISE